MGVLKKKKQQLSSLIQLPPPTPSPTHLNPILLPTNPLQPTPLNLTPIPKKIEPSSPTPQPPSARSPGPHSGAIKIPSPCIFCVSTFSSWAEMKEHIEKDHK